MQSAVISAPDDGSVLGSVELDDRRSLDAKVSAARAAMREWSRTSAMRRATALLAIAHDTRAALPHLAAALSKEQGKTVREALLELDRYIGPLEQYAGLATGAGGRHHRLGGTVQGHVEREPVGVVAGIVPWNFPASLFATKLAPALAAGCGFLIKPAETTPLITGRLADIARRHLPPGLLDVVHGGPEIGDALVGHPGVARIAFTGSTQVGRQIARRAADGFKRVSLEMGGCDPFVLLPGADLPAAVRALAGSRFYNAGQVCVAPKRLIVDAHVADEAVDLLEARLARVRPGPGADSASTMGPLHAEAVRDRLEGQILDAEQVGARIVGGGRPADPRLDGGWFVSPSLILDPPPHARVRTEETFGPALTVIRVKDDDQAAAVASETPYSLGASVWAGDSDRAWALARRITAGYTWINTLGRVYDELPFGGVGASGLGREHGTEALDSYFEDRVYVYPAPA